VTMWVGDIEARGGLLLGGVGDSCMNEDGE
jgi:hypothetical protein